MPTGRMSGKVALISGGGRGQGRSHALRLASEGADIVTFDVPARVEWLGYETSTEDDLAETARLVEAQGGRILTRRADVRDGASLAAVVADALETFGHIDVVVANAGIGPGASAFWKIPEEQWQDMLDINLSGVWRTVSAAVPSMLEAGRGGSIIITSSAAALRGGSNIAAYTAAKMGLVGLMQTMARELAQRYIRVNVIAPSNVATPMIMNDATYRLFRPDLDEPTLDDARSSFRRVNLLPEPWLEAADISAAVAFLASDDARYITGSVFPVDLGGTLK